MRMQGTIPPSNEDAFSGLMGIALLFGVTLFVALVVTVALFAALAG